LKNNFKNAKKVKKKLGTKKRKNFYYTFIELGTYTNATEEKISKGR